MFKPLFCWSEKKSRQVSRKFPPQNQIFANELLQERREKKKQFVQCNVHGRKSTMRCVFTAICTLAEEIHCNVGHDAGTTASAMFLFVPRCGELRFPSPVLCPRPCLGHIEKGGHGEGVFAFACQGIASLRGRTGNRTVTQMHKCMCDIFSLLKDDQILRDKRVEGFSIR